MKWLIHSTAVKFIFSRQNVVYRSKDKFQVVSQVLKPSNVMCGEDCYGPKMLSLESILEMKIFVGTNLVKQNLEQQ